MKKTYISPIAKGIELRFEGLIAQSPTSVDVDNDKDNIDGGDSNRRTSIWGDEN